MSDPGQLGPAFDLLAAYRDPDGCFFERAGVGAATSGVAARLDVRDALRSLRASIEGGGNAEQWIALGALPFTDPAGATLSVGRRTVSRRDAGAGAEVLEIGAPDTARFERIRGSPAEAFTALQLRPLPAPDDYVTAVHEATQQIRGGSRRKVVLARTIEVDAGRALDPERLVQRLRAVDPSAYAFAMPTEHGVVVGASPELLVARAGHRVRSNPLAGSAPRSGDPDEDRANGAELVSSAKDREEHAIVVEAVADVLGSFCDELSWDPEPVLLATPNVWHLSTRFEGRLRDPAPHALELALALHPTPAVAGTPTAAALATIAALEPFDRGVYAGPVGWMDAAGDGVWAIALRCAELRGDGAVLYAGAGIVADSDPTAELDETERKFRAFLDALRWG